MEFVTEPGTFTLVAEVNAGSVEICNSYIWKVVPTGRGVELLQSRSGVRLVFLALLLGETRVGTIGGLAVVRLRITDHGPVPLLTRQYRVVPAGRLEAGVYVESVVVVSTTFADLAKLIAL